MPRLAWMSIFRLEKLWKAPDDVASKTIKRKLFLTLVQSVFVYGGPTWPLTEEWRTRIDKTFDDMLRYCIGPAVNTLALHDGGNIPLLSSLVLQRRLNTVGHVLRHPQGLADVLLNKPAKGRTRGLEACIVRETREALCKDGHGGEREEWLEVAKQAGGKVWAACAREAAAAHEDRRYNCLERESQRRRQHPDYEEKERKRQEYLEENRPAHARKNLPPPPDSSARVNRIRHPTAGKSKPKQGAARAARV